MHLFAAACTSHLANSDSKRALHTLVQNLLRGGRSCGVRRRVAVLVCRDGCRDEIEDRVHYLRTRDNVHDQTQQSQPQLWCQEKPEISELIAGVDQTADRDLLSTPCRSSTQLGIGGSTNTSNRSLTGFKIYICAELNNTKTHSRAVSGHKQSATAVSSQAGKVVNRLGARDDVFEIVDRNAFRTGMLLRLESCEGHMQHFQLTAFPTDGSTDLLSSKRDRTHCRGILLHVFAIVGLRSCKSVSQLVHEPAFPGRLQKALTPYACRQEPKHINRYVRGGVEDSWP